MLRIIQNGHLPPVRCLAGYGSTRFTYQSVNKPPHRGENFYQVLNVPVHSSDQEIKSAFIELSKKYHPDANTQTCDSEVFMKICEAYQTLHRPNSRQMYDSRLRMQHQTGCSTPPDTAFTGRQMSTVWSQYQSAMRSKQMGRSSKPFGTAKPMVFKPSAASEFLPVRMAMGDLQRSWDFADEEAGGDGYGYGGSWDYSFPNSPIFYLYVTGLCGVGGLVFVDAVGRFRNKPRSEAGRDSSAAE